MQAPDYLCTPAPSTIEFNEHDSRLLRKPKSKEEYLGSSDEKGLVCPKQKLEGIAATVLEVLSMNNAVLKETKQREASILTAIKKEPTLKKNNKKETKHDIAFLKNAVQRLDTVVEALQRENATVKKENAELKEKMNVIERENATVKKENATVKKENAELKEKMNLMDERWSRKFAKQEFDIEYTRHLLKLNANHHNSTLVVRQVLTEYSGSLTEAQKAWKQGIANSLAHPTLKDSSENDLLIYFEKAEVPEIVMTKTQYLVMVEQVLMQYAQYK